MCKMRKRTMGVRNVVTTLAFGKANADTSANDAIGIHVSETMWMPCVAVCVILPFRNLAIGYSTYFGSSVRVSALCWLR